MFGKESIHYTTFEQRFRHLVYESVGVALGIMKAAKDDYEHNYLFDIRSLIQAEVFDDFLEQAMHLLERGYHGPAAVIAGCVLEDGLRRLCVQNSVPVPSRTTIEPMNVALVKSDVYGVVLKGQISALATIRNTAAHGKWNEFDTKDVEQMISDVQIFMENCFGSTK